MMNFVNFWLAGALFLGLFACRSESRSSGGDIDFGIYETLDASGLSQEIDQHLHRMQVETVAENQGIIAGFTILQDQAFRDSIAYAFLKDGIRFAVTAFPMEEGESVRAVVALKQPAVIGMNDIREAVAIGDRVEIRFNMKGARKWAEMTERNTGRQVAFVFEEKIYNLPLVAAPIRSGVALITGLEADEAVRITGLMNSETNR